MLPAQGLIRRGIRKLAAPVRSERFHKSVARLRRDLTPIDDDTLRCALDEVVGSPPEVMLVHSSLSACGRFTAGPECILDTLSDYAGTLTLVTHSYCYPAEPDVPGPVFDAATTPSQSGLLTNLFLRRPRVVRSIHATHALAATGPLANEVVRDHHCWDSPTGPGTPYSRLVERRASVLMFGVTFHSYTFFHTAEFGAESAYAYQHGVIDRLRFVDETGTVRECRSRRQNWDAMRFAEAGELMERKGLARSVRLGRNRLRFVPDAAKAHDFLLDRLRKTPDFLRAACTVDLY